MNIRIEIVNDQATPLLRGLRRGLANKRQMNRAAAEGMLPLVQRNLRMMGATNHNSFGVRSSFWNQMLSATRSGVDDAGGFVAMPSPVALRYFGGTVTPKMAKNLAIPARSEAYGKSPRDFSDLRLAVFGKTLALVQADQQKIGYRKMKDGSVKITHGAVKGGGVFYWLVPEATIEGNEAVLPSSRELGDAAEQGVVDYIQLLAERAAR